MLPSSGYFKSLYCPYYKSGFCCRPHCHYKHAHSTTASYTASSTTKATYIPTPVIKNKIPEYKPTPIAELKKRKVAESLLPPEPLVKVKKESLSCDDNDFISSIIGSKVISSSSTKEKVKEDNNSKSNHCKKSSSKGVDSNKPSKTKTQLIAEKEEELRKKKISKDLKNNNNSERSSNGKHTKETVKSSLTKLSSPSSLNSSKSTTDGDKKFINSPSIKLDDSFLSLSSSSAPNNDINKKSPTKQPTLSDNKDIDLARFLESPSADDDLVILSVAKKSRVAHSGPSELSMKLISSKKPVKLTPSQVMYNRFNSLSNNKESTNDTTTNDSCTKKRIVHNVTKTSQVLSSTQKTTPIVPTKKRPIIPAEFGGKIPMAIRTRYLNSLIDELLKFCSEDESYSRGLTEEKTIYTRSTSKNVYLNLAVNAIKRIRNEANAKLANDSANQQVNSKVNSDQSTIASLGNRPVSHTMILNGPHAEGCSIEKRRSSITVKDLTDAQLYTALKRYIMSVNKLAEYGYPRLDPTVKGKAILPPGDSKCKNNFTSTRRICYRCMKTFIVDEFGYPVNLESCVYHSGRLWNERFNRSIEKKYSCCKGDLTTGGCCSGKSHVVDGHCHPNYLLDFVQTRPKSPDEHGFYGIYALDCEMSYTTIGLELTRVSVIDHKQKCVYESLVKPNNPVLDYNTKFSGIKEGDLDQINVSLKDVQEKLLSFIGDKTILIGHSLESDLKALKIIHDTVIDTAEVFPHRRGLPYKRALRTLMAEFMQSIIQNDVDGHDSQEDAVACMKLILWKVSQDLSKIKR